MFLTEDARQIQDEVMAEIKSALFNIDPKLPAASGSKDTINDHQESCSSNAQSPRDSETCDLTEVDESTEGDANEESLVPTKMGPSLETHLRISSSMGGSSAGGSTMNDSFVDRMNLSCGSSIGGSSLGTLDSQKYYIGSAHGSDEVEDETSSHFGSHMGDGEEDFGMEDMSRTELMQVVRTLYRELRKADESLSDEKKRRHSREKNLIKLARELKKRKDATTKLTLKMEELQEELGVAQSEKELLEQRLSIEKERSSETRDTLLKQIDRETRTVKDQYIGIIADHERRIADLNESHVEQCEHLCREVVDSNQEIMRLQKVIAHLAVPGTLDRNINTNVAMSATRKSRSRTVPRMMAALMVFVVGLLLGNQCHNFSQVIESDAVVKSLGAFLQSFSLFATTEGPPILEDEEELPSPQDTPVATTRANHLMEVLEYTLE